MSKTYKANSMCLRYIVPFKYMDSFEEAYEKVERQKEEKLKEDKETGEKKFDGSRRVWMRKTSSIGGAESDLYGYIKNEFRFESDTEKLTEEKFGCEWLFWKSDESKAEDKNGKPIKELLYYPKGISKRDTKLPSGWDVIISNIGLLLFRNGLGLIWYEMRIPKKGIDSNQLKQFQNSIRELNRGAKTLLWEKSNEKPVQGGIVLKEVKGLKTYIAPFAIGILLHELLGFLNINYLAERKAAYGSMLRNTMNNLSGLANEIVGAEGRFLEYDVAPDKAILFTYISFDTEGCEDDLHDRQILAYHLTNGYRDSYHLSEAVSLEMKRPFEDVLWYATQEGAAYLSWPGEDNKFFFTNNIISKIKTDYFTLYLKTLYQSFSLLIYAEKIQMEISAVKEKYLTESFDGSIIELSGEINLFLTKSMATSVSHIHHQSEFYVYLKKQLRIHNDVKSVTSGLNALDMLQREQRQREELEKNLKAWEDEKKRDRQEQKRDERIQAGLGLFSVLAIGSALVDTFDFLAKFDPKAEDGWIYMLDCWPILIVEIVATVVVLIVGFLACSFAWKAFKKSTENDDEDSDLNT